MRKDLNINSKLVAIYPDHHMVLAAWATFRQMLVNPPVLISLDHHTDTHPAFLATAFDHNKMKSNEDLRQAMISGMNFMSLQTITNAVDNLKHDEHIDAALKSKILSKAFVISYDASFDHPPSYEESAYREQIQKNMFSQHRNNDPPSRPFTYPESDLYLVGNLCAVGCQRHPHDDDCTIPHYDQAIESDFLEQKLSIMREMSPTIFDGELIKEPYILDIDLDYFHTCKSIMPSDPTTFYRLINGALLITVATEDIFIDMWRDEHGFDKNLTVDFLIERLHEHIQVATG